MATNRDLLKEAIADAKAVKEMAIANAKAALEEAFTPQLQSMLSAKLQEMEEEEEELDEVGFGKMTADSDEGFSEMGEKALDETDDSDEYDRDLDELLSELNDDEEMESEDEEMESEEEGEPLDLEDMTDEDLKKFIEDVISDMVSSGELEAGEEAEGEENEEIEGEEKEINLDELLAEIEDMDEEMEEESMMYEEDEVEEGFTDLFKGAASKFLSANKAEADKIIAMDDKKAALVAAEPLITRFRKEQLAKGQTPDAIRSDVSDLRQKLGLSGLGGASKSSVSTAENLQKDLDEALATIETLRGDLNEVNLLNAKLLYTNKIFKAKNLTESQKVNVLTTFDKATTVKEVKLVFETISNGLKSKSTKVNENYGSASKGVGTTNTKQPILESDPMVARFQKLAGII